MDKDTQEINDFLTKQYFEHPFHKKLENIYKDAIKNEPDGLEDSQINQQVAFFRFTFLLSISKEILDGIDPVLTTNNQINNIANNINALETLWTNFKNDLNQWKPLNNQVDSFINVLNGLKINKIDTAQMSLLYEEYYQKVTSLKRNATQAHNEISSIKRSLKDLSKNIDAQKTSLDNIASNQTEKFSAAQSQRAEEFSRSQIEYDKKIETYLNDNQTKLTHLFDKINDEYLLEIKKKLEEAKDIVGTISTTAITGNYERIARREFWSAWGMRLLALIFFGASFWFLYRLISNISTSDNINWILSVFRFTLGLIFLGPATYCANESTKHWKREREYQKIALELSSIESYLDRIADAEIKRTILTEKSNAYFGADHVTSGGEENELKNTRLSIQTIMDILQDIAKSFRS